MKNNGNQSQRIYDKATRTWYEVPEDQYREFDRWRTNLRKREQYWGCLLYTSPSPRDRSLSRMPSSA